jgi:hypothetical protein
VAHHIWLHSHAGHKSLGHILQKSYKSHKK